MGKYCFGIDVGGKSNIAAADCNGLRRLVDAV